MPGSNLSTSLVGAGNADGLFPVITPAPAPSPGPAGTNPVADHSVSPAGRAMDVVTSAPATPVLALIGLGVAFLLAMTRLSVRRRRKHTAGRFPQITPAAPTPIPIPGLAGTNPAAEHNVSPSGQAVDVSAGAPATPVLGLIALGVAVLLVTSRLFARRRRNRR
jgi:hypothetical protein